MIGKEILNYTIVSLVGKGGMGSVYLAEHKYIKQQKVAIKVINGNMINDFTRQRLAEEADRLARLNHPNIVHFINYHIDEAGSIYLIMEYADGYSLEDYIKNVSGLIVEEKICSFFEPILDAFDYAHKHKIIHKDIKPSNIIITNEGIPKILDFGIAALLDETGNDKDKDVIMGTPSFMSPEQVKGDTLDPRSDIYSLGVLLHQMLTGNPPYDTTTLTEHDIYKHVVEDELPRMKTYYKYVSDKVQTIVDKATNKKIESRYQSCEEFKKALHNAIYPPKISKGVKAMITAVAAVVILGVFFIWDYNRVKISYYKDYTEQWSVPQGIGKLTKDEVEHREASYRFEYSKRKLRRMSLVNSYGKITEHHDSEHMERPSDMLLFYNDNGNISYSKILDKSGKVLYKKSYNDKLNTVIFQYDDENSTEFVLAATTMELFQDPFASTDNKGKITRYLLTYDENGYIEKQEYASFFNTKVGDADGIYARTYKRDEKGRVIEESYLGYDGNPKGNKAGLGIRKHKYNENDDWIETSYYTLDGQESTDGNGVPVVIIDVDQYGNRIRESYFDGNGTPVLRTDCKAAGFAYKRNERGLCIEMTYFDIEGNLCYSSDGGVAGYVQEYDNNGYESKLICLNDEKQTTINIDGWAYRTAVNDSLGNVLEAWFYDVDNKLVESSEGYAGIKMKYDLRGNQTEFITYGLDKNPCVQYDNTAGYKVEYNEQNFIVKLTNLDESLKPCKNSSGVVIWTKEYDNRGNCTKISYFDENNKLTLSNENIAGANYVYDDYGNEVERSFFDAEEKPCLIDNSYHKVIYTFDQNGNLSSERYYDLNNNLTLNTNGIAGYDYVMDERGNILESTPIGKNGKLQNGWLIAKQKYDKSDNVVEYALYDSKGPALNSLNYHRYTCKYNNRNQVTEIAYYGKKGELVCYDDDKYAIQQQEYDAKGNRSRCTFLGTNGKPVLCSEGWYTSTYEYDAQGRIIRQLFYGIDGKPTNPKVMVPEGICNYDKWGNMIYIAACDGNGNLIMNPQLEWSFMRSEYDNKGNVMWTSYFDHKEKPILCKDGFHKVVYTYTDNGKEQTKSYFSTNGSPMLCEEGYHKIEYSYTDSNKIHTISYFNAKGEPMLVNNYHKQINKYDGNGLEIENAYYDTKGKPINAYSWIHKVTMKYDKNNIPTERKGYDINGTQLVHEQFIDGEWVEVRDWQKEVKEYFGNDLPIEGGEELGNIVIYSYKIKKSAVEILIKTPFSKYAMSNEDIDIYKALAELFIIFLEDDMDLPNNVKLTYVLEDSKGRELSKGK